MEWMLPALAFALLIGGQFLAAIVLISKHKAIYNEIENPQEAVQSPSEQIARAAAADELREAA